MYVKRKDIRVIDISASESSMGNWGSEDRRILRTQKPRTDAKCVH